MIMVAATVMAFMIMMRHASFENGFDNFFQHRLAKRAYQFASQHAHTGSRADFWPQLFSAEKADPFRIYSPRLETVWPNISHPFSDRRDWFTDKTIIKMMETIPVMKEEDITANYMRNIQTLNAAVKAVQ